MENQHTHPKTGLLSITAIGVSSIIGSGWLFSAYYTAQYAGSMSLVSWIIGAVFALSLALMLAEIATMFPVVGLTARLLSLSHNRDYGFVISSANWLGAILIVPSEAQATVQYLSYLYPKLQASIMVAGNLNSLGVLVVALLIVIYGFINYWGIKVMSKVTNIIVVFKIVVPLASAIILMYTAFNPSNFTYYKHTLAPYGFGSAFSAVITGGIFYSFLGFGSITTFASEVKNPKRNIPLALCLSIAICLVIYLLLQIAFIGAIPTSMLVNGWHGINFSSPIVQLVLLLNLNFWAIILYLDAAVSPSGTGITYVGAASRTLTGMAHDQQMPQFFNKVHAKFNLSRRSLAASLVVCLLVVIFFRSWHAIMITISTLQLLTCISIPVALVKFRQTEAKTKRSFKLYLGKTVSFIIFNAISYFIIQTGFSSLLYSLVLILVVFIVYVFNQYKCNITRSIQAFGSAWTIFLYMIVMTTFGYISDKGFLSSIFGFIVLFIITSGIYFLMVNQKNKQVEEISGNL